jgi:hypothetical protein
MPALSPSKVRVLADSDNEEGGIDDAVSHKVPWLTMQTKDGSMSIGIAGEQPTAISGKVEPYTGSKALGHAAPRAFEHGVCCGCNDHPVCHKHCFMATFCPCVLIAKLKVLTAGTGAWPQGNYAAQLRWSGLPFLLAFVGYFAIIMLVPLLMMGRAQPPPPKPSPVDPWYYVRYPAYAAAPAHAFGALLVALLRMHYRQRHRIRTVPGGHTAAQSLTDEDELWKLPCLALCARCDDLSQSLLCGCCLLIQMADDFEVTTGEKIFGEGDSGAASLCADPGEAV